MFPLGAVMKMVEKHWIWLYILSSALEKIPDIIVSIHCKDQTSREVRVSTIYELKT